MRSDRWGNHACRLVCVTSESVVIYEKLVGRKDQLDAEYFKVDDRICPFSL